MSKHLLKLIAAVLVLALATPLAGCQSNQPDMDAVVDAAVKAALEASAAPATVTFEVDGKRITVEDAQGKTAAQLLELADITLQPGDILSLAADQTVTGSVTLQVLRRVKVTVVVAGAEPTDDVYCTVVLPGGTVADALAAAGVEVAEGQTVNHPLDTALTEAMEIAVYTEVVETVPPTTEAPAPNTGNGGGGGNTYVPSPPPPPKPTQPKPTEPAPTEPKPTQPKRTVVSVEIYEDCDGSGHGVKVITYSDGTQEEVPF